MERKPNGKCRHGFDPPFLFQRHADCSVQFGDHKILIDRINFPLVSLGNIAKSLALVALLLPSACVLNVYMDEGFVWVDGIGYPVRSVQGEVAGFDVGGHQVEVNGYWHNCKPSVSCKLTVIKVLDGKSGAPRDEDGGS